MSKNQNNHDWIAADVVFLRTQWTGGLSAGQIAAVMGLSRNSVIGKIHRMGMGGRGQPTTCVKRGVRRTGPRQRSEYYARVKTPPAERLPLPVRPKNVAEPISLELSFEELMPHQCKWPSGDGPFTFCGTPSFLDRPYCLFHCKTAYTPNEKRARA